MKKILNCFLGLVVKTSFLIIELKRLKNTFMTMKLSNKAQKGVFWLIFQEKYHFGPYSALNYFSREPMNESRQNRSFKYPYDNIGGGRNIEI